MENIPRQTIEAQQASFAGQLLREEHELTAARENVLRREASVQHLNGALAALDSLLKLKETPPAKPARKTKSRT